MNKRIRILFETEPNVKQKIDYYCFINHCTLSEALNIFVKQYLDNDIKFNASYNKIKDDVE